ncbi:hypothetical protein ZIOFF_052504 [Zingiber officinale]|uniref:Uncharacterized protein n=1 Tax=Zingiber officinale TaxID=94328 RepID=A0A8J5FVD1_ZINOF|nr:hypothetical protein ZIOFF_052504 [Zingiber officinale]
MEVLLSHSFLFDIFISPLYSQCFVQRHARELGRFRKTEEMSNPYDVEEMAMPLQEFINDPIAHEIIHNGATFQVLYECFMANTTKKANTGRKGAFWKGLMPLSYNCCISIFVLTSNYSVLMVQHRLDHMLYVGLTEEHKKSANLFAELVGAQVISQSEALSSTEQETTNKTDIFSAEPSFSSSDSADGLNQVEDIAGYPKKTEVPSPHDEPGRENMTVGKLMEAYEKCSSNLRKSQSTRRTMSLKKISPVNFSKKLCKVEHGDTMVLRNLVSEASFPNFAKFYSGYPKFNVVTSYLEITSLYRRVVVSESYSSDCIHARRSVPASILDQIQYLNSLDVELYKHAQDIFRRQEKHVMQNDDNQEELQTSGCGSLFSCSAWKILSIIAFLAVIVLVILVTKRGRAGKLKM